METVQQLKSLINSGKIIFDNNSTQLRQQLLQEIAGQLISEKLQKLVVFLAESTDTHIRISSIVRNPNILSDHGKRTAVDIGNEEIANSLLPKLAIPSNIALFDIDEIIFNAGGALPSGPNRWNYKNGSPFNFSDGVLNNHSDHIHISVKS